MAKLNNLLGRLMSATTAFLTTFNERALVPSERYAWDDYDYRAIRYALAEGYYSNVVYSQIETYAPKLKVDRHLYKHIRGIYNPVNRLVEFYASKLYGGVLDFEDMSNGALPLNLLNPALELPIRQTWLWSNWRSQKTVYGRTGAKCGDVFLWVADDVEARKVRLEVVQPYKVQALDVDGAGNVTAATLEYLREDDGGEYTYKLEIDKALFKSYRNGKDDDEWPNLYGFVPLVQVQHRDVGMGWGTYAFHGSEAKIDEVNDAASVLNDGVRKMVTPPLAITNATAQTTVTTGADGTKTPGQGLKDETPILYLPKDAIVTYLTMPINVADATANVQALLEELERDMPELAMHRLRQISRPTAPGVKAAFDDAITRVEETRSLYDDGYVRAQKMAVSIGGFRGYEGFEGFDLNSYAAGDMEFYVRGRPVIQDSLAKTERITAFQQAASLSGPYQRFILQELDVPETDIQEAIDATQAMADQQARAAARGLFDSAFGGNNANANTANARPGLDPGQNEAGVDGATGAASVNGGETLAR